MWAEKPSKNSNAANHHMVGSSNMRIEILRELPKGSMVVLQRKEFEALFRDSDPRRRADNIVGSSKCKCKCKCKANANANANANGMMQAAKMPRYYFHVRWPGRKDDDPTGMWLADDPTARDYAEQLINEMKEGEGHDPNLTMVVERAGTVLFTLQE